MNLKPVGIRKSGRTRSAGGRRSPSAVKRIKVVGLKRRRGTKSILRKRRGIRGRYRLRRGGRVFYPASSQAYHQGYNQAYEEGFKAGFAQGYEDGLIPPAPV